MSEAWTQLLRDVDNGLTRAIDLERVTISRSTGNMHAYFTSSRLLSSRERGIMERAMRAGFPKVELATSVRYPSLREKALADINAYKGAVIELVTAESPASMPYLTWSDGTWQLDGDQLTVNVNAKEGAEFLRIRGVDLMIARFLKELFNIEVRVTIAVTGSEAERIRRISEKRREEEALMARAAREMTTQHEVEEPAPSLAVRGQPFTDPIISMGELTEDERLFYTWTLQCHIDIAKAVWLDYCDCHMLDTIAREPLWRHLINYRCGTGHGVGFISGVHEGPQSLRPNNPVIFKPGMTITDEPGIYETDEVGIRIENEIECYHKADNQYGTFLAFRPLTFVPIATSPIVPGVLDKEQVAWLNDYHRKVFEQLAPRLTEDERAWLAEKCAAIGC